MSEIVRGTTPTIRFNYKVVPIDSVVELYLTMKQFNKKLVEKSLSEATVGDRYFEWKLSQEETLKIVANQMVEIQATYKLADGTRGASKIYQVEGYKILKDEVI